MNTLYRPELLYANSKFLVNAGLLVGEDGRVLEVVKPFDSVPANIVEMPGKALLPGFVNAHSHSFQRLIRGKSESRVTSGSDFWSWRGTMYHAASRLDPQDVYDAARMAFLEMVLAGTTTVGEFHYLHNAPDGKSYDDPNLLAKQVIAAAESVGMRIVLLRTAYLRSGFEVPRDPGQIRFFESADAFLGNAEALLREYFDSPQVSVGIAPHSIRAVPIGDLRQIAEWNRSAELPMHMHVSEQVAENEACLREYGLTPVELLRRERILSPSFTAVHAIHIKSDELAMLADGGATICACPTTERNLGDGIFPADLAMSVGIPIALGSDSQVQIDPLEDARELDYHLRLQQQMRAILEGDSKGLAQSLFDCATMHGARSLRAAVRNLRPGNYADFFTVDMRDPSIAGCSADDLLPILVFSLNRSAIRDVVVGGKMILRDQQHPLQDEIIVEYERVRRKVWRIGES